MIARGARSELLWVLVGQVLSLLLGVGALKALTYLLGPEQYGEFALGLSVAGVLNLFIYGPLGQAVSRYFHLCEDDGGVQMLDRLIVVLMRSVALMVVMATLLAIGVLAFFGTAVAPRWQFLVLLAIGYGLAGGSLSVYLAGLNTRRERRSYALIQSGDAALRLFCAVVLVVLAGGNASVAMAGFLLGSVVSAWCAWLVLRRKSKAVKVPPVERALFGPNAMGRGFIRYAGSFLLFAFPAALASYADRWIVQQTLSVADVGIYVALLQIANAPANLMLSVFSQTLNPILFQRAGKASSEESLHASRRLLYRALLLLAAMLVMVTGVSYMLGEELVLLMTSSAFVPYAGLLWILVLSAAIFQIGQGLASEAFVYNRPFLLFFPKMAHATVFLGLSLWLVRDRQLEGMAIAAAVAAVVYLLLVANANIRARN